MTYGAFTAREFAPFEFERRSPAPLPQALLCAIVLVLSASAGLWILYGRQDAGVPAVSVPLAVLQQALPPSRKAQPSTRLAAAVPPIRRYAALLDPTFTSGARPLAFAQSAPLRSRFQAAAQPSAGMAAAAQTDAPMQTAELQAAETPDTEARPSAETAILPAVPAASKLVENIPLPAPRPALLSQVEDAPLPSVGGRRVAQQYAAAAPVAPGAMVEPNRPGFFEKIFGAATQPSSNVLAYAAPEDGRGGLLGSRAVVNDHQTAIYDISAHTVYLPDGTRLEAHSGLGAALDDPRSVAARMRGATPPNVYELTPREAPFHGVRALRLTPVGEGTTFGRGGLLAHTFMLGPRGDSNGCVVFRKYQAFLNAYESGQVRRLQVVARL